MSDPAQLAIVEGIIVTKPFKEGYEQYRKEQSLLPEVFAFDMRNEYSREIELKLNTDGKELAFLWFFSLYGTNEDNKMRNLTEDEYKNLIAKAARAD